MNTPLGEFFLELSDDTTPITVNNFLRYVNDDLYDGTFVHRLEPGFVIQGGWLRYTEAPSAVSMIPNFGNIQNEFRVSNQRGTIAMAKVPGDPNSATSQWFINLGNNSFLDTDNGGFTVFGRVMGNGMQVVDSIAALQRFNLGGGLTTVPLIDFSALPLLNRHMVSLTMSVAGSTDGHAAMFRPENARLRAFVDAGELGLLSVEFDLISENPNIVIKLDPASLFPLEAAVDNMATFNNNSGVLTIPEIQVNGQVAWRNVRFQLTNATGFEFTLTGLD
ncbi:MAG: peptidylprolyl isomerase [Gammaproteobacteria bacterium]|nr:peptidylprolyl isomerase [Gammaproteobacteria bacterium]